MLIAPDSYAARHLGSDSATIQEMLAVVGYPSLEALVDAAVPAQLRLRRPLELPPPRTEAEALAELRRMLSANQLRPTFIGQGYYGCWTPPVIQRNILENPAWYTPYTPYQAEISQGRLEALLNFQQMVVDLTGLDIANASLLDEATAAAEAMMLCRRVHPNPQARTFFVSEGCHPQTIAVVQTRAEPLGINVVVGDHRRFTISDAVFGLLVQYPATDGIVYDYSTLCAEAHRHNALVVCAADLLALTLLKPPGEFGADVAVGSTQRFGMPPGYGGPHAAYFATRDAYKRQLPGRLVGVSRDAQGRPALRLALQTREQHIRRDKATSNICTAQVLPAIVAAMYCVWHGPDGLKRIAQRVHTLACRLAAAIGEPQPGLFFDTLRFCTAPRPAEVNVRNYPDGSWGVSVDETTTVTDLELIAGKPLPQASPLDFGPLTRTTPFLTHPVFHRYHTEHEMLRYLRRLEARDYSLCHGMIPLGSCTMKLTAAAAMQPLSWPEVNQLHPFVPPEQARGYQHLIEQLERWLAEITGFAAICFQPNAGSQGEYAGLLTIRAYHRHCGQPQRNVCLIPLSAHGTNPASATLAGLTVVPIACDAHGNIDLTDLQAKAAAHADKLAAIMITYPSTHGVFEPTIAEVCRIVHEHGGQVYMDGANLNAMVGICRLADLGADVCQLNLHKTFGMPHGGGGPGVGPIGVAAHLVQFIPAHISAAPYGSASILPITWMYLAMMGTEGLTAASQLAILNANYVARRLDPYFPVLYKGAAGLVAHECILDFRNARHRADVEVEDVAKRLMDYGFHAPTMSWPVPGTLMVEPTESESKAELDRFCEALIAIHAEIEAIAAGRLDRQNNPLKNAPHTALVCAADRWDRPYSREQAAFPAPWTREQKFWPAVSRVDNVYGDRHLFCGCPPMS